MLTIFVCFAAADRSVAEAIAGRLEATAEVRVILDEIADHTLPAAWEAGAASAGIVLLLSPESVPSRLSRDDWAGILEHAEAHANPPIACLLVQDCRFPKLLERNRFWRWYEAGATLRALQRWAISLHATAGGGFVPAPQPHFSGREEELDALRELLVDQPDVILIAGPPRSGKTSLAQEFARQSNDYFRKVVWVSCRGRSRASVLGDVAAQLGLRSPQSPEHSMARLFEQHRLLAVFDELEDDEFIHKLGSRAASVLVVRRERIAKVKSIQVEHMPVASAGVPDTADEQALWEAMTVCRADQVSLELAGRVAELPARRVAEACRRLLEKRIVDPLDEASASYRLTRPAHIHSREYELRRRHARFASDHIGSSTAEAEAAFSWSCGADWELAPPLARKLFNYLSTEGRSDEKVLVLKRLEAAAEQCGDWGTLDFARHELSWISGSPWTRASTTADQLHFDFVV